MRTGAGHAGLGRSDVNASHLSPTPFFFPFFPNAIINKGVIIFNSRLALLSSLQNSLCF